MAVLQQNTSDKPWLVLKFGGTSVGKFLDTIVNTIIRNLLNDYRVVVVCSARSTDNKREGTTSRLLRAAEAVATPRAYMDDGEEGADYHAIVDAICAEHISAAREHVREAASCDALARQLEKECARLRSFLEAAEVIDEVSSRSRDIIIGTGERLMCQLATAALRDVGIDAAYVSLERVIQRAFDAKQLDQSFYDYLAARMSAAVRQCGDRIPVVTGYFGMVPGGILNSVGRGYTDLTAALIAVGLGAKELQVWKEVDGVFTADPRKVPEARVLPIITPEEAAELTYYGSEVIHPFTMEQVIRARIPIRIKNVKNPSGEGTVIFPDNAYLASSSSAMSSPEPASPPRVLIENGYAGDMSRRHPTAVTIKDDVIVLNIHSNRKSVSHGFFAQVFSTLDAYGIVVDLISTSEVHVSMALGAHTNERALKHAIRALGRFGTIDVIKNMAILSLVGRQMRNLVGIAGRMFNALADAKVNIEMISQGASEINISCVIEQQAADRALNVIHERLLAKPPVAIGLDDVSTALEAMVANSTSTEQQSIVR
ncbi:Aspartate/glutamate/uridylate kinase [Syncephalis pseudoplumigaleata]|uniref:Aspartokinase n=1 Tax=Syncephalis pseudoplumigaleata TaxID=1712513 RepID=A0A4P9Z433_9FUNG|nr:Aspartate/glutamate/uridylate kinase [Syncephalis pseudoplumigaleata]|eukprot:RKP26581.1 Aspartate/glutamate/uridylate kinase [Syncephalis pseudoplumigaleata]